MLEKARQGFGIFFKTPKIRIRRISESLLHVRRLVYISIMTALLIVGARLTIQIGAVPLTLQTISVAIAAYILGPIYAGITTIIYVFLGASGMPVFAKGGGAGIIMGITGGFILGFIPMSIIIGISKRIDSDIIQVLFGMIALFVLYLCGTAGMVIVAPSKEFGKTLGGLFITFGLKDALSIVLGQVIAKRIKNRMGDALILYEREQ